MRGESFGMILVREQFSLLDLNELCTSCELLEHSPRLPDWKERIFGAPDTKHGRQDPAMHRRKAARLLSRSST